MTAVEAAQNREINRKRWVVERTFGSLKRWFDSGSTQLKGLPKVHAEHVMEAIAHNLKRFPVIAPESILQRNENRIKADQRDARKLAEFFANNLLTECFIPNQEFESARSLVRSRTGLRQTLHRTKLRTIHLLPGRDMIYNAGNY